MSKDEPRLIFKRDSDVAEKLQRSKKKSTDVDALREEIAKKPASKIKPKKLRLTAARESERVLEEKLVDYDLSQKAVDDQRTKIKNMERGVKDLDEEIEQNEKVLAMVQKQVDDFKHERENLLSNIEEERAELKEQDQTENVIAALEDCNVKWRDLPKSIVKKERDRSLRRRAKKVVDGQ